MREVEVVLTNNDRVTLRVGDTFLKVDADPTRTGIEVEAIELAPVPTPEVRWREPPVLALAAVPGLPLGRLGRALDRIVCSLGSRWHRPSKAACRAATAVARDQRR